MVNYLEEIRKGQLAKEDEIVNLRNSLKDLFKKISEVGSETTVNQIMLMAEFNLPELKIIINKINAVL